MEAIKKRLYGLIYAVGVSTTLAPLQGPGSWVGPPGSGYTVSLWPCRSSPRLLSRCALY